MAKIPSLSGKTFLDLKQILANIRYNLLEYKDVIILISLIIIALPFIYAFNIYLSEKYPPA